MVAAVTGYALGGGCELALCADVRIAAEDATLGQPEILLGIIPGAGGTQRLTRLVGPSRAKDIIFTGRFVKADEALAIGLVDRVVPADRGVRRGAWRGPRQFAGAATYALRAAKESIDRGLEVDLDTGLEIERQQFAALFATEDRAIGMRSFVENGPGKAAFVGPMSARLACDDSREGTPWPTDAERADRKSDRKPGEAPIGRRVVAASCGARAGPGRLARSCVLAALFLAVGALLVALEGQPGQRHRRSSCSTAPTRVDLGVFSRDDGIKEFTGENAAVKSALVNWGLAAIAWLVVGQILDRLIRP